MDKVRGRGFVTVWIVEKDARGWSVVREGEEGPIREHLSGLPCITAQVVAAELNSAYELGREEGVADIWPCCSGDY